MKWLVVLAFVAACGGSAPKPKGTHGGGGMRGKATWYNDTHTASGERFDPNALTAAHRTFPFGTRVRVTNLRNGKSVVVRINDRGPYGKAIIDLSRAAAKQLDMIEAGVVPVKLERLP